MSKKEIKVNFLDSDNLKKLIEESYFKDGYNGKINGKENFLKIENDVDFTIFKGLDKNIVKLLNEDLINGTIRVIIEEDNGDIRLYPVSIYCVKEKEKYTFY